MPFISNIDALTNLFLQLVAVDGVSLHERLIADRIKSLLRAQKIHVIEDGAAKSLSGEAGNLICLPPDFNANAPAIMLSAHLDTVQSTAALRTAVGNGRIHSDGTTILGADNRLGVTALMNLLLNLSLLPPAHKNFFVVFTVAEELGMLGAAQLDLSAYHIEGGFVFDCSQRPGVYIQNCAGAAVFQARVLGKAAHAGVAPEEGINAIALASAALAKIQTGRLDAETIVNIAKISGGKALNIVPDEVVVEGEVRGFVVARINEQLASIQQEFLDAKQNGRIAFNSQTDFVPYSLTTQSPVVTRLDRALRAVNLEPKPIRYMGGSDANVWNAKGVPAVNIGIGAQKPHSHEEFVLIEDLIKAAEIALALVE